MLPHLSLAELLPLLTLHARTNSKHRAPRCVCTAPCVQVDRIKEIGDHDKKILKETKQIAKVEQLIREKQERFDAAIKERQKRAKEKEDDKFMKEKKSQRETAAESHRQIDYAVKSEMALQTKVQSAEEAKKQAERAARGETERKLTERQRQEWVDEKVRQKALDIVEEKKLFKMDETIRAEYKAGRKALKQLRRKQGSDKMLQQMEESKMLEQMEREKMLADKKAFRAKMRAKSAETVVLKEAAVRLEEERLAANALWDAHRQVEDMKLAKSREHAAHETLAQVTKTHKRDKLAPSRTGYEARMRKIFGTPGSSDEVDMGTNLMFITRAM